MGRRKLWDERIMLPLKSEMLERIDAALRKDEPRLDLIREAIEQELRKRERSDQADIQRSQMHRAREEMERQRMFEMEKRARIETEKKEKLQEATIQSIRQQLDRMEKAMAKGTTTKKKTTKAKKEE